MLTPLIQKELTSLWSKCFVIEWLINTVYGDINDNGPKGATHEVYLKRKNIISTPLIMEKPVRSPMVPPMRLSWASVLIFLSLSMSSKVAVSK